MQFEARTLQGNAVAEFFVGVVNNECGRHIHFFPQIALAGRNEDPLTSGKAATLSMPVGLGW